jgi:hypothetical protein
MSKMLPHPSSVYSITAQIGNKPPLFPLLATSQQILELGILANFAHIINDVIWID